MTQTQLWDAGRVVIKGRQGRPVTVCHCGNCEKCKHRDYMRDYSRGIRRGRPQPGSKETRSGPNKDGYMLVRLRHDDALISMATKEGVVLEHRLVMARHLGRPLAADEFPHHRNGDKTDNRIENLELWTVNHPKGQRVDEKLSWAIEFVMRYKPDFFSRQTT